MSFAFPKPVPESRSSSSVSGSDSDSDFDINEYYYELLWQPGPDYDELIIPLSLCAFNRLSLSDQREQLEEIRRHNVNVNGEESGDFTELFKKLNYSHQQKLLSKFLQKFKREAIIPGMFRSLLLLPGKILRKVKMIHPMIMETGSCVFGEFFIGFSIIWFQGQLARGQDMLIEQLSKGIGGTVVIEPRLQDGETEQDFKLRRFTELCNKIVDFRVQEKFLDNVERKLEMWGYHFSDRLILEPQEYDRAAELLSHLSSLGYSLLSAKYQQHKIEEMSNLIEGGVAIIEETTRDDDEEDFRMTRFTELFNQVPVPIRIDLFKELREILLQEKLYSEGVRFFRGLGSMDQTEMIEKLTDEIIKYSWEECDPVELIIEKFSGESEEDFRLRRFKMVCSKHVSTCGYIVRPEAYQQRVRQGTSEESSPYASFLFDASITWFKARCGNYRRNPIHVILFGQVEFCDVIEKVPEESEEDFGLRRFKESFKQLEFTFQDGIVDYIQDTLFGDLGYPVCYATGSSPTLPSEGRGSFDSEWIKLKLPHLQDQGAAAAATTTRGATNQGGGRGRGQGTCTSTVG